MADLSNPPPAALGANAPDSHDALPPGTKLDEFEIVRVLGSGGFGIVYLALDQVLLRYVAIKEYLPNTLAGRGKGSAVSVRSSSHAKTFAAGLDSFINEARLLASFDHPSLLKVHRFWKSNGTAYMVMHYYAGQTLKEARRTLPAPPDEAWLRGVLDPLLGALESLHSQGVFHRDIAPDNILLLPDGQPVILDFGSARRVIGDQTQSLTALLKPNFSPVEQYADEASMRQGPYTDLYALGATVQFMLTGRAPMPAVMRAVRDSMPSLAADPALYPGVSREFLAVIDWTLALAPGDRPQGVEAMRQALRGDIVPPPATERAPMTEAPSTTAFNATLALAKTEAFPKTVKAESSSPARRATPSSPAAASGIAAAKPVKTPRRPTPRLALAALGACALGAAIWGGVLMSHPSTAVAKSANEPPASTILSTAPNLVAAQSAAIVMATPAALSSGASTAASTAAGIGAVAIPASGVALPNGSAAAPVPATVAGPSTPLTTAQPIGATPSANERVLRPALARAATQRTASRPTANDRSHTEPPSSAATTVAAVAEPRLVPPAAEPVGRSPVTLCGNLGFFAATACLNRTCQDPAVRSNPQCVDLRRLAEQRQRRMEQ